MLPESHSFGNYISPEAEILVIGTFPTHERNRQFEFFYPNKSNVFWKIIADVFEHEFKYAQGDDAVNERKMLAIKCKIALTDMLAKAIRGKDNSGDDQLIPLELMDIISILKSCPTINRLILTSRSGDVNALTLFQRHLSENKIPLFTIKDGNLIKGTFELEGKKYHVFVPYSPSPRVERQYGFAFISKMYRDCLK